MKIRILQKSRASSQALLDLSTGKVEFYILSVDDNSLSEFPVKGVYEIINNHLVILYKPEVDKVLLRVDVDEFVINDKFSLKYHIEGNRGILIIRDHSKVISLDIFLGNLFPVSTFHYSEDEEDVNFLLWLSNVLNSKERFKILLDT
ncbi:hypothetical protein LZZ85_21895 [Terrimonas sp. NA20]|uniref:Uncharacterized protein n=1 Tax=Terrimonas ginsenosidimutans TaxID=2908004 RepID=A0ABS9KXB4_9BACT|nr:hypothetical protein [Terrimonas ginsenosidimutans]MCG2616965.1 hypothetical protein [Terrimonas ginsenosidimutans]